MLAGFPRIGPAQKQEEMGLPLTPQCFFSRYPPSDLDDFLEPVTLDEGGQPEFGWPIETNTNVVLVNRALCYQIAQHFKQKRRVTFPLVEISCVGQGKVLCQAFRAGREVIWIETVRDRIYRRRRELLLKGMGPWSRYRHQGAGHP